MTLPDWLDNFTVRSIIAGVVADRDYSRLPVLADAIEDAGYSDPGAEGLEWEGVARCLRSDDPAIARVELARLLRGLAGELDPDYYRHPTNPYTPGAPRPGDQAATNVIDDVLEDEDDEAWASFNQGPQAFHRMVQNSWGWDGPAHTAVRQGQAAEELERLFATLTQGTFDLAETRGHIEQMMPQPRGWAAHPLFDPQLQTPTLERAMGLGRLAPGLAPGDVLLVGANGHPLAVPQAHLFHLPGDPPPQPDGFEELFRPVARTQFQFPARRHHGIVHGRPG